MNAHTYSSLELSKTVLSLFYGSVYGWWGTGMFQINAFAFSYIASGFILTQNYGWHVYMGATWAAWFDNFFLWLSALQLLCPLPFLFYSACLWEVKKKSDSQIWKWRKGQKKEFTFIEKSCMLFVALMKESGITD